MINQLFKPFIKFNSFWLLNLPFFFLLITRYGHYSSVEGVDYFYFFILSIGQAGVISWLMVIVLPGIIEIISCKKINTFYVAIFLALCALLFLVVDLVVYSQYRIHLNTPLLQMILSPARSQIFNLSVSENIILLTVIVSLVVLEIVLYKISCVFDKKIRVSSVITLIICLFLFGIAQLIHVWADAVYEVRILASTEIVPLFRGFTAKRILARKFGIHSKTYPAKMVAGTTRMMNYPIHPLTHAKDSLKPNILMIVIDAWRSDSLNQKITPSLANLATNSNRYLQHFSGGNCTRAGIFSLLYSLSPDRFEQFYREARGPVLFDVLIKDHYAVAAYTSASAINPPFHRTAFVNVPGFQPEIPGKGHADRDAEVTVRLKRFIEKSKENKQPFFAFAFYDSAHAFDLPVQSEPPPFQPTQHINRLNINDEHQQLLHHNQYLNSLNYIDSLVGKILSYLKENNLMDSTMIIVTSDHGEEFNDNGDGFWGHNSNFTPAQTQVPLIVHWPKQQQRRVYQHITTHYDIVPTLLQQVLSISNPISDYSIGTFLDDSQLRDIIIMASYNNIAVYSPLKNAMVVTNSLGYFQVHNLQGKLLPNLAVDGELIALAFQRMQHFTKPQIN